MGCNKIILIGSSVGGPPLLNTIFSDMPRLEGSVIIIQHMPDYINKHLSEGLAKLTEMDVSVAENMQLLEDGHVYIAPSGKHLTIMDNFQISLGYGEKVNHACPSIDVTMKSIKPALGIKLMGIILSGIGRDGAEGIIRMKEIGAKTIALSEESSVVFGMPSEAIKTGKVDRILNIEQIREVMISFLEAEAFV